MTIKYNEQGKINQRWTPDIKPHDKARVLGCFRDFSCVKSSDSLKLFVNRPTFVASQLIFCGFWQKRAVFSFQSSSYVAGRQGSGVFLTNCQHPIPFNPKFLLFFFASKRSRLAVSVSIPPHLSPSLGNECAGKEFIEVKMPRRSEPEQQLSHLFHLDALPNNLCSHSTKYFTEKSETTPHIWGSEKEQNPTKYEHEQTYFTRSTIALRHSWCCRLTKRFLNQPRTLQLSKEKWKKTFLWQKDTERSRE